MRQRIHGLKTKNKIYVTLEFSKKIYKGIKNIYKHLHSRLHEETQKYQCEFLKGGGISPDSRRKNQNLKCTKPISASSPL